MKMLVVMKNNSFQSQFCLETISNESKPLELHEVFFIGNVHDF